MLSLIAERALIERGCREACIGSRNSQQLQWATASDAVAHCNRVEELGIDNPRTNICCFDIMIA
jgi:hypothetical protein